MCSCHSILECCVMFSGVKLSIRSFVLFVKFKNPNIVKLADNSVLHAYGKGTVQLSVYDGIEKVKVTLKYVLYVLKIQNKLLSLSSMADKGTEVQFRGQSCKVMIDDKVYCIAHKHGKLYKLNSEPQATCCFGSTDKKDDSLSMWYARFGHLNYDCLKMLDSKSLVKGLSFNQNEIFDRKCQGCAYGKQHRLPFPKKSDHECKQPLELIHTDVCGPMSINSVVGSRYFITFTDDYTHEMIDKLREHVEMAENFTRQRVKRIRLDNEQEYVSEEFKAFCKSRGILKDDTIPYTPQQNGVAKCMNRTIMETVHSMIHSAGLPLSFWAEAVNPAVYLRNRSPTSSLKDSRPYEYWHNEKPDISHLKVFGCNVFVHVPDPKRKKLDKKSISCIFVGYPEGSKGCKVYNPDTKKFLRSRDVVFLENSFGHKSLEGEKDAILLINESYFNPEFDYEDSKDQVFVNNQDDVPDVPQGRPEHNRVAPDRLGVITGEW